MRRLLSRRLNRTTGTDEGSALMLALVVVLLGSLLVIPLLSYAVAVTTSSRIEVTKTARSEAVKGALRTALANGKDLYAQCSTSGATTSRPIASPGLGIATSTTCTTVKDTTEMKSSDLRVAMTTVQLGALAPVGTVGTPYAGSGLGTSAWTADTTAVSTGGKILLPQLPGHSLTHPSSTGYPMPAWAGSCIAYFPGTYTDPITISSSTPVYFTSGIYYFENTVTFTGSANVVIGGGSVDGCTSDQDAAYNAINAPINHNITGYGATFVLGAAGRLVVNDSIAGTGPVVNFNNRLVADTDISNQPSKGVNIESVNGVSSGGSSVDLNQSYLFVPHSMSTGSPAVDAASNGYNASTLVPLATPVVLPAVQTNPVIDFSFTGANNGTLYVPGYVSVPQGRININVSATSLVKKNISLLGGVLAAQFTQGAAQPAIQQLGIVNRVVQKTFKIVSTTTSGTPVVVSVAQVQVNDYGEYVVNSWIITTGGG